MQNHYQILGIVQSATHEEIRRAYRILARRYHPDVNPGKSSEAKFKIISQAYSVLSDAEKRKVYDLELELYLKRQGAAANGQNYTYDRTGRPTRNSQSAGGSSAGRTTAQERFRRSQTQSQKESQPTPSTVSTGEIGTKIIQKVFSFGKTLKEAVTAPKQIANANDATKKRDRTPTSVAKISFIEVSISVHDAIKGVKKTVEIQEPEGVRKVSVNIPPGVRSGSVVQFRSKGERNEDLVVIIRVAAHPFISILPKGLVVEIPISVKEAVTGASLTVPSLDEPIVIKVPPGSQSGTDIRIRSRGVHYKDGERGDLFYRLMIKIPESISAVGIQDKVTDLEGYYERSVRIGLPQSILEM